MNLDRSIKLRDQAKSCVIAAWNAGQIYGLTSSEIHKRVLDFFENAPKGCPRWVKAYADGFYDAKQMEAYHNYLEFRYVMKDGRVTSTHRKSDIYYEKMGITPQQLCEDSVRSGHYWIKSGRPFYESETDHLRGHLKKEN